MTSRLLLIRLFQQGTICSVRACHALDFRGICASFRGSSRLRQRVRTIWCRAVGRTDSRVRAAGTGRAYRLLELRRWQCVACRYQISLTVGTVFHNTKMPLTAWFWAAYLAVTDKRGISALLLQRQLGLRRYETAWMLLHKLRRAMVNAGREPLHGDVEIDDTWGRWTTTGPAG
jgi:hypothetical protein